MNSVQVIVLVRNDLLSSRKTAWTAISTEVVFDQRNNPKFYYLILNI